MAILKKYKKVASVSEFVEEETGEYITVRKWLTRIHTVADIDTKEVWTIDSDCKLIYAYLFNFGKRYGWNSIYPNQELITKELGIPLRTIKRKIKVLGGSGLIDVIKTKDKGLYWSNQYRVKKPPYIGRRVWRDANKVELVGSLYNFSMSNFKRK